MATTTGGLPYPVPTDPVALGAANIQALAEAVDPRIGLQVTPATMPASPFDGQRIRLLVDAAKGIEWLFVYRAASSNAEKWEFLGGPPLQASEPTLVSMTPNVSSTLGPIVTVPRPGLYEIYVRSDIAAGSGAGGAIGQVRPIVSGTQVDLLGSHVLAAGTNVSVIQPDTIAAADGTVQMLVFANAAANSLNRVTRIRPLRIT